MKITSTVQFIGTIMIMLIAFTIVTATAIIITVHAQQNTTPIVAEETDTMTAITQDALALDVIHLQ